MYRKKTGRMEGGRTGNIIPRTSAIFRVNNFFAHTTCGGVVLNLSPFFFLQYIKERSYTRVYIQDEAYTYIRIARWSLKGGFTFVAIPHQLLPAHQ